MARGPRIKSEDDARDLALASPIKYICTGSVGPVLSRPCAGTGVERHRVVRRSAGRRRKPRPDDRIASRHPRASPGDLPTKRVMGGQRSSDQVRGRRSRLSACLAHKAHLRGLFRSCPVPASRRDLREVGRTAGSRRGGRDRGGKDNGSCKQTPPDHPFFNRSSYRICPGPEARRPGSGSCPVSRACSTMAKRSVMPEI